jgi:hypothetical protein
MLFNKLKYRQKIYKILKILHVRRIKEDKGLVLPSYFHFQYNDCRTNIFYKVNFQKFEKFKFYNFVWDPHASTGNTANTTDFFRELSDEEKNELRHNPYQFWALDLSFEGFGSISWFKLLTDAARRYDIPRHKLFFISSNLKAEEAYETWCVENQIQDRINVVSICLFKAFFKYIIPINRHVPAKKISAWLHTNPYKYFLSLNRRKRIFRMHTVYSLFRSPIWNHGYVSHDMMNSLDIAALMNYLQTNDEPIDRAKLLDFVSILPLCLDRQDFDTNWAKWAYFSPEHFFKSTIFHAVGETLSDTELDTTLFFSEKSFRPIIYNQPLIIFGQQGINTAFTKLNMMPYKNYFNLDFDNNPDSKSRVDQIVNEMERVCKLLDGMSTGSRIEWMLQDRETLEHNKNELLTQSFNLAQIKKLYDKLMILTQ